MGHDAHEMLLDDLVMPGSRGRHWDLVKDPGGHLKESQSAGTKQVVSGSVVRIAVTWNPKYTTIFENCPEAERGPIHITLKTRKRNE